MNMVELNQNQNPDQDQAPDLIPKYPPPILLSNPQRHLRLVQQHTGRGDGPTQNSGNIGERCAEKQ